MCHAAKYSQYGCTTDKCVLYRNQENAIFTYLIMPEQNCTILAVESPSG